jgi:hypothetical protein
MSYHSPQRRKRQRGKGPKLYAVYPLPCQACEDDIRIAFWLCKNDAKLHGQRHYGYYEIRAVESV